MVPIEVAARLTGLSAHTLRAWERRYGFPNPRRAAAGARHYDERQVRTLRLLARVIASGWRPHEVVGKTERELEKLVPGEPRLDPFEGSIAAILDATRQGRIDDVCDELRRVALLATTKELVERLLSPLLVRLGDAWEAGEIGIHEEHCVSEAIATQLRVMRTALPRRTGRVILLATLPNEHHTLGLELVALQASASGLRPFVLGGPTPPDAIAKAARATEARIVGITVVIPRPDAASDVAALHRALPNGTELWLGGAGASGIALPGTRVMLARTWEDVERLVVEA